MVGNTNTVLVADDDPAVVDQLQSWLDDYRVEATTDGDETIACLETADAVVVDHDLLTVSGAVAAELERRATTQTLAFLCEQTDAHKHPFSIANTLVKPVEKDTVVETVDRLLRRARYDELIAECTTLATKRGALEAGGNTASDTASDARSETLQRDLDELFTELDDLVGSFDSDDFRAAFATCEFGTTIQPRRASECS